MSQNSQDQEPSIEEILASIRQIISDDDEEVVDKKDEPEEAIDNPVHDSRDDVLELSAEDLVEDVPEEDVSEDTQEDIEEESEPESEPMEIELRDRLDEIRSASKKSETEELEEPEMPEFNAEPKTVPSDILSSSTQAAALSSLSKLATKMPIERSRSYDGVTLEDIVRELLHPMLREWMDENLPSMVERTVQKELEKLARRAMDD